MDLDINGPVNFININLNSLTKFVADVTFNNGEIYVSTYLGNDAFQTIKINEEIPDSYFKLAVEIDKSTSQFNLLINEKVVFTGQAGDSYLNLRAKVRHWVFVHLFSRRGLGEKSSSNLKSRSSPLENILLHIFSLVALTG